MTTNNEVIADFKDRYNKFYIQIPLNQLNTFICYSAKQNNKGSCMNVSISHFQTCKVKAQ